jgi:U6 snRNA-associated Sm-like protein LSm7
MFLLINFPKTDSEDPEKITDQKRKLGLVVVRGTQVSLVSPQEGMEEIANPFIAAEE